MRNLLIALILLFLNSSINLLNDVYICISNTASKYHLSENCRGLARWTHTISKVSLKETQQSGYTLCKWEN